MVHCTQKLVPRKFDSCRVTGLRAYCQSGVSARLSSSAWLVLPQRLPRRQCLRPTQIRVCRQSQIGKATLATKLNPIVPILSGELMLNRAARGPARTNAWPLSLTGAATPVCGPNPTAQMPSGEQMSKLAALPHVEKHPALTSIITAQFWELRTSLATVC